jgi:hypothetical protein
LRPRHTIARQRRQRERSKLLSREPRALKQAKQQRVGVTATALGRRDAALGVGAERSLDAGEQSVEARQRTRDCERMLADARR